MRRPITANEALGWSRADPGLHHPRHLHPDGKRKGFRLGTLTTGPGGPTALTGTTDPPHLQLSGKKKQSLRQPLPTQACIENGRCQTAGVLVRVSCGGEACTARAKGKLTKVKKDKLKSPRAPGGFGSADLVRGETTATLALKLTRKQRSQARKGARRGREGQGEGHRRATDAASHLETAKRTIRLVK
jgi:hypothetical protein